MCPPRSVRPRAARPGASLGWILGLLLWLVPSITRAELQFDVFLGFDDHVREGSWFPAGFEIYNDGPSFTGTVVIGPENRLQASRHVFTIELPTGTRKRVVIPLFASGERLGRWDVRLLGADGEIVAEHTALATKSTAAGVPLLGSLSRTFGGLPVLPETDDRNDEFKPAVARLRAEFLPENPMVLEALTAWYLNSEPAVNLRPEQVDALLAWVHAGGHLIVAIENPTDINAVPWLRQILPFEPSGIETRRIEGALEQWITSGASRVRVNVRTHAFAAGGIAQEVDVENPFAGVRIDTGFYDAEAPVVVGKVRDGEVLAHAGETPLIIKARRGRGKVTALAFSPEVEPYRSWQNRSWFWAKVAEVPPEYVAKVDVPWGGTSVDGIYGAMLDSRQIRKLPVGALLLLLVVYLAVIGPLDQWVLRKLNRQVWTWVTFPVEVVLFSALIYYIGYRLRAGELEWNELQVVDQLPRQENAILRGRTWVSVYSPVNSLYRMESDRPFSLIRTEFAPGGPAPGESDRITVRHPGNGFQAEAFIPVWVNQLYSSDWLEPAPMMIEAAVRVDPGGLPTLTLTNRSSRVFHQVEIVLGEAIHAIGTLQPGEGVERTLDPGSSRPLQALSAGALQQATQAANQRRAAFGSQTWFDLSLDGVIVTSLAAHLGRQPTLYGRLVAPAGFDLTPALERGDALLFAWAQSQSVADPIHRFTPRRTRRDTVVRLVLPVRGSDRASL